MRISVIIPTKDAGKILYRLLTSLINQSLKPDQLIIIDSSSKDNTVKIASEFKADIIQIKEEEFDHGRTRNLGASVATGDILIFMTQDAIPENEKTLESLIAPLCEPSVGAVYARQIPRDDSNPVEKYFRLFNYPAYRMVKEINGKYDVRKFFFSDVCSAIRRSVFKDIGGFPEDTIMNEDMLLAVKLLKKGYKIVYEPNAKVYHSHNYSFPLLFKRYFDIGVFMSRNRWIKDLSKVEKEGIKYFFGLVRFLIREKKWIWIPYAILDTSVRFSGYRIGLMEKYIPLKIKKKISLNKNFWRKAYVRETDSP